MSLSDDEALFDDIYGEEAAPVKPETSTELTSETTAADVKEEKTETTVTDAAIKTEDPVLDTAPGTDDNASANPDVAVPEVSSVTPELGIKTEESPANNSESLIPASTGTPVETSAPASVPASAPAVLTTATATTTTAPLSFPPVAPPPPVTSHQTQQQRDEERRRADLSRDASKMFIGGLDWDTSEESMKEYFSQFGEVVDHTIMRENATGRSRGFGFLTFADPKSVDKVVRQQHVLDGKVIDPKRAIPREEQDKTGKIFVGGLAPEVRPHEFEAFFAKFGSIIDAQLMLDKDTGRSRGFGFVTFDEPEAVDKACQSRFIDFNGKQIEVKRAEPRGAQQQQNHQQQQQQRFMNQNSHSQHSQQQQQQGSMNMGMMGAMAGMFQQQQMQQQQMQMQASPSAYNDYIRQLEQYWTQVQQTQQVTPEMTEQFQQYINAVRQQASAATASAGSSHSSTPPSGPSGSSGSAPYGPASYGQDFSRLPRGPSGGHRGNSGGRPRGRGRGGNRNGGYHPYSRN